MTAFFNSIRNYFKSEYHGRYLSLILLEIARHERETFGLVIAQITATSTLPFWRTLTAGIERGELTVRCEFPFKGRRKKKRRADLAVLRGDVPVLLMEVKEFDHLSSGNPDQLSDYLGQVSEQKGFVHVHRFLPGPDERSKIESMAARKLPVAMLNYNQLYKAVIDVDKRQALAALLRDYLGDIGVGIYKPVTKEDRKPLAFLMAQMLGFPHQTGMGRLQGDATVRRGPDLISQLLGNIEVVGEWVRLPNENIMKTHCFTRFIIDPWLQHKKLRKNIQCSGDRAGSLPNGFRQYVEGGTIYFQATVGIRSNRMRKYDYFRLELGFGLELKKGGVPRFFAYTQFKGNGFDFEKTHEQTNFFLKFPNESAAYEKFADCLSVSKRKLVKITAGEKKRLARLISIPDTAV